METEKKPSRGKRLLLLAGGGIILMCICLFVIVVAFPSEPDSEIGENASSGKESDATAVQGETETIDSTSIPISEPTETNPPKPTPTPIFGQIKIGTHLVGNDIEPGTYRGSAGEGILDSCYWERLSDLSGELGSISANDNAVGQFYVEVKETDFAFKTDCEMILLEYALIIEGGDTLAAGTYLIGRDIRPGLYQGQAGEDILDSCYWARLKNVSGDLGSILANDNATGSYYVQILESDFALNTGCSLEWVSE